MFKYSSIRHKFHYDYYHSEYLFSFTPPRLYKDVVDDILTTFDILKNPPPIIYAYPEKIESMFCRRYGNLWK